MKDEYFTFVKEEWKAHYKLLQDTISQLQTKGIARKDVKSSWSALVVLGAITWITYWYDYNRKNQIDGLAESVEKILLGGLSSSLSESKNEKERQVVNKLDKRIKGK